MSAPNVNELFAEGGRGLFSISADEIGAVLPAESVHLQIQGRDIEYSLVDWLNKLLEAFDTRRMLFTDFDVRVSADSLDVVAKGERVDGRRDRLDHEIKAATYHGLKVEQTDDAWRSEVVLDI